MITVKVDASKKYAIAIGQKILPECGKLIKQVKGVCKAAVISDDKVFGIYGQTVCDSLEKEGYSVCCFAFPNGEKSKNLSTYANVLDFLAKEHVTRTDIIVALGGGVVGDLAGFCAATYLRGIEFVQIPTSLLAAVDSSVGGKTAVDLELGKNLVGAFHQPSIVICDTKCFETLDSLQVASGFAEVIKYGVMCDEKFFDMLEISADNPDMEKIVERCVSIKRDVVNKDEFDTGCRALLNLGHTLGHAVEKHSNFSLTHGAAVAIGMMMIARISEKCGFAKEDFSQRLKIVLEKYSLPTQYNISYDELFNIACADKKTSGKSITLVMPLKIGECVLEKMALEEFKEKISQTF